TVQDDAIQLQGEVRAAGSFAVSLTVTDAAGTRISDAFRIRVADLDVPTEQLVAAANGASTLDART
ncbi:MAG: hypothetical protein GWN71_10710, partial [Gammaproteobacteria bacterium]|nr:hypothetical protein [Gemmatimonadota bacterium]NIU74033.1 hypothetical protein [Gammaproteobacteria bacterium]NIX21226.1 hypothetical protein [Actinomycetota bacterium]